MRLYKRMKKRLAKKKMGNFLWARCTNPNFRFPKIGEVYEDCDCFNHIVTEIKLVKKYSRRGWVLYDAYYIREDEHYFCGCLSPMLCPPQTPENIRKYWKMDEYGAKYIEEQRELGWWTAESDRKLEFVRNGGNVCDERGLPSKEWLALK